MNTIAEVISIEKNKAVVISNNVQLSVDIDKLEFTGQQIQKKKSSTINVIRTKENETTGYFGQLDIRGKRADDALHAVSRYIDDAVIDHNKFLKILHGTGNGILREVVRDYLRSHQLVKHYKDERIEAGGSGITLVELDI
jgi:DNA mismatch repair protein MutS2